MRRSNVIVLILVNLIRSERVKYSLNQSMPPKLLDHLSNRSQNHQTNLKLFCSIEHGTKPLQFEWRKNNKILAIDDEADITESNQRIRIENGVETSILFINNLNRYDSGDYVCLVRNEFGEDSQSTSLIVKGLSKVIRN